MSADRRIRTGKKAKPKGPEIPLLALATEMAEAQRAPGRTSQIGSTIRQLLRHGRLLETNTDHVAYLTPQRTFLNTVVQLFDKHTDIPPKMPLFIALGHTSAMLLHEGTMLEMDGSELSPDIWCSVLARSGAGKTFSAKYLQKIAPVQQFPGSGTAAKFMMDLSEFNRTLWHADEFGLFLHNIENRESHQEIKEYLLKLYDGDTLRRRTKSAPIEVANPALTIIGTTVAATFKEYLTADMLLGGFAQRFQYVHVDESRSPMPIYSINRHENILAGRNSWERVTRVRRHLRYRVSSHALHVFHDRYLALFGSDPDADASFFRRVLWRAPKYALLYHVLLGKGGPTVDTEDMEWGLRVSELHLHDFRKVMDQFEMSRLAAVVEKAERCRDQIRATQGRDVNARDLISKVHQIDSASTARFVLEVISGAI